MSDKEVKDQGHLPCLKIPCSIVKNPTYFTKYLPAIENDNRFQRHLSEHEERILLPALIGKGVQRQSENTPGTLRYETAYGNAYLFKQIIDRQMDLGYLTNALEKTFPKPRTRNVRQDFFKYKHMVKRDYKLWEPKKEIKYYQGDIDKRLVEAKQRLNKTWRKELKEYFKKEKKNEDVILRRADTMDKGLKAYLRSVDKEIQKYEQDEAMTKLRQEIGRETDKKPFKVKKFKKFEQKKTRKTSFQIDFFYDYDFDFYYS